MTSIDEIVRELRAHAQQCREFEQPVTADHLEGAADALLSALGSRRMEEALVEAGLIIRGFLQCAEIADCAAEDKDFETDKLEGRARNWIESLDGAALEDNPNG